MALRLYFLSCQSGSGCMGLSANFNLGENAKGKDKIEMWDIIHLLIFLLPMNAK